MQQDISGTNLSIKNIDNLIELLKNEKNYKQAIKYGINNYNINPYKINKIKLQDIPDLINLIEVNYINYDKEQIQNEEKKKCLWLANQLKLFVWMAVCYSYMLNKPIENMDQENWQFFAQTLTRKSTEDLEFQSKAFFKNFKGNKEKWDEQEQQLLREIIENEQYHNKWNDISKLLYLQSDKKYYRSSQKCRQHWFNHLDPRLCKNPWTVDEDLRLIHELQNHGFKWSKITQIVEAKSGYRRTEHMVKNRAKLLCKKYGYKDQKEQGCQRELKLIQKRLNEQKKKLIYEENNNKTQIRQGSENNRKFQRPVIGTKKSEQVMQSLIGVSLDQNKMVNSWQRSYCSSVNQNSNHQNSQLTIKIQDNCEQSTIEIKHKQIQLDSSDSQQSQSEYRCGRSKKKRNIIILQSSQPQKVQKSNPSMIDQDQSSIQIGEHVQVQNQSNQQSIQIVNGKQQDYDDEYQIIEEVENEDLNLNDDIKFDHELHGGKMRDRVTHQLAHFFNNASKDSESERNL